MLDRIINGCCRMLEALIACALLIMVVLVFGNVVLRYGFNSGITISEEVARWLFVWLTFVGAVVAVRERGHLGTDIVVSRLGPVGRRFCKAIGLVAMLYVVWLLIRGSYAQMLINADTTAPVTGASVAIFYASGVFFSIPAALLLALELWRTLAGKDPAGEARPSAAPASQVSETNPANGQPN
jgi:TRAP-type transport system small permease protein